MGNRNFGEIVQGPMTPGAPSVEDLRAEMFGSEVAGKFAFREPQGVQVASVTEGRETRLGDGTVTDEEMAAFRRMATIQGRRSLPDHRSCVERRDPVTGVAVRTYADGRTEEVDEQARRERGRV